MNGSVYFGWEEGIPIHSTKASKVLKGLRSIIPLGDKEGKNITGKGNWLSFSLQE